MSTNLELGPEPARGAVFIEQVKAVGVAMRRELLLLLALLLGSGVLILVLSSMGGFPDRVAFMPQDVAGFVIVAVGVPLLVWRLETPARRTYLWSLPVSRRSGQLAKLASGWLWTMLAVALVAFWLWAMAAVTDGRMWRESIYLDRSDLAVGSPLQLVGDVALYVYQLPIWLLLIPFGFATVLYLVGSTVVLSTNHPFRWAIGIWCLLLAVGGLHEVREEANDARLRVLLENLEAQQRTAFLEDRAAQDTFLERLLENEKPYGLANLVEPEVARYEVIPGTNGPQLVPRADFSNWVSSMAIWGGLALLAAYVAAARHREP